MSRTRSGSAGRFYVAPPALDADAITIDTHLAQRLAKVLRLHAGDEVTLFDGSGSEVQARINALDARAGLATVLERYDGAPEPRVRVHLYQAITKGERFEWLIEKGTEVGVAAFTPLITARSVVRTGGEGARLDRWRRIAVEAAEQSGRSVVPAVNPPATFDDAIARADGVLLLPYEAAPTEAPSVQHAIDAEVDALFALSAVSIFIGPEGGYEDAEVERARAAGAAVVTIGPRVLRSETAGLVAATLTLHATGDLG
jgi:16S rRNA (uracil1498-N3)-methyltransferase